MSETHNYGMVELVRAGLLSNLKKVLTEEVVSELVTDYEKVVRSKIEPVVEKITLAGIESYRDVSHFMEEVKVSIMVKDNED
jgi:hypothetical protein